LSRKELDIQTLQRIGEKLPDLDNLKKMIMPLAPDFISSSFEPDSMVPVAAVCLRDALDTLYAARYALHEVYAHQIAYLEQADEPNEGVAAFFGRYYADDLALRLYAASEHLAFAISAMLQISSAEIEPFLNKKGRASYAIVVGKYLADIKPDHPITSSVLALARLPEWRKTMRYRNDWVHQQPPLVNGLGIAWQRRKRWEVVDQPDGSKIRMLNFGGGDPAEYSVEDLLAFMKPALEQFARTLANVSEHYIDLIQAKGITKSGITLSITLGQRRN
jgi:hypothetical protein